MGRMTVGIVARRDFGRRRWVAAALAGVTVGVLPAVTLPSSAAWAAGIAPGTTVAWGWNAFGQLGDGTVADRSTPTPTVAVGPVRALAAGQLHNILIRGDGSVVASGANWAGQVGDGTTEQRATPVPVVGLDGHGGAASVAAGAQHSVVAMADGSVLAWGFNDVGQVGDGTTATRLAAVPVAALGAGSGVVAVAAGYDHSLALKADGSVVAWGRNVRGALGDGSTIHRTAPVAVAGLGAGSGVVAIAAGGESSLALKADGTVLAWGTNDFGQLGDGTSIHRSTPVQVAGLGVGSGVTAIAEGGVHGMAAKVDGSVVAWGWNGFGQLGDGTSETRFMPVAVAGFGPANAAAKVAGNYGNSVALTRSGEVLAWGWNGHGQLGDGSTTDRRLPGAVATLGSGSGVTLVAAGQRHMLAAAADLTPPSVSSVVIGAPSPTDRLLQRALTVQAGDAGGSGLRALEYGWVTGQASSPFPGMNLNVIPTTVSTTVSAVSFADASPDSAATLFVRAVDAAGNRSEWSSVAVAKTPARPMLVALGDSVTSGHHKDATAAPTTCTDPEYSYAINTWLEIQALLPPAWKGGQYANFARSGSSTTEVIFGGKDECKQDFSSQTAFARAVLAGRRDSWNTMVMTAGINDTNWTKVLENTFRSTTQAECQAIVDRDWDLSKNRATVSANVLSIVQTMRVDDPSIRVALYGYYNVAGTGFIPLVGQPVAPAVCEIPFDLAMNQLHGAMVESLFAARPSIPYTFVASDRILHGNNSLLQGFYLDDAGRAKAPKVLRLDVNSGWPHPNAEGARLLGAACRNPAIAVPHAPCL